MIAVFVYCINKRIQHFFKVCYFMFAHVISILYHSAAHRELVCAPLKSVVRSSVYSFLTTGEHLSCNYFLRNLRIRKNINGNLCLSWFVCFSVYLCLFVCWFICFLACLVGCSEFFQLLWNKNINKYLYTKS